MMHKFEKLGLVQHNFLFFRSISSKIMAEFTKESEAFLANSEKTHETARMAQKLL